MYTIKCKNCGEIFKSDKHNTQYCNECKKIKDKESRKREQSLYKFEKNERVIKKNENNIIKLNKDSKKARESGMSYGQWRAKQYMNN